MSLARLICQSNKHKTVFAKASFPTFSKAKNHRQNPLVPLVAPTINLSHLDLIPHYRNNTHTLAKEASKSANPTA
ncbi:aspartate-semialdehyde dehydrogenase [Elasticomyces elasticus]|nr:aspartate-semialdehyde dehydrogenase [Elasticomyces elasticus]